MKIRCGDTVYHRPTGEKWLVAYADYDLSRVGWFGWPPGCAHLQDCELILEATDAEHLARVSEWLDQPHEDDERVRAVRRLYRPEKP